MKNIAWKVIIVIMCIICSIEVGVELPVIEKAIEFVSKLPIK